MHLDIDPQHRLTSEDLERIARLEEMERAMVRTVADAGLGQPEEPRIFSTESPQGFHLDVVLPLPYHLYDDINDLRTGGI